MYISMICTINIAQWPSAREKFIASCGRKSHWHTGWGRFAVLW